MNLASIDLNLLVALDALLSEAHVGRAGRKIGLSQPATSHALKRLRDLLTDPLLVRVGSRMELTPRAVELRDGLPDALQRVQTLFVGESFDPGKTLRRFSIMLQDHIAQLVVPKLVNLVQAKAPGVRLDFLPWQSPTAIRREKLGNIDLFVSCALSEFPSFEREALFQDAEVTVVQKRHPAGSRLRQLKVFLEARHVAVAGKGLMEDPVDTWLRQEGLQRKIVLRVPSYRHALEVVAQTDLVAFVPKRFAQSMAKPLSLTLYAPPIDPGEYQEHVFYPRRTLRDAGSIWLRELVLAIGNGIRSAQA
jgi:DNA-binding transcriptional LysR family regulator